MIAQQKKQRNTSANIGSAVYSRRIALNSAAIVRVREFLAALWVKVRIEKPGWGSTAFLPTFIADKSRSSKTSGKTIKETSLRFLINIDKKRE